MFRKIVPVARSLKRCDCLHSVPFYYRSPFRFSLPLAFKRYRLASVFYSRVISISYVHRRDSDKTYASCWLARVTVGPLVLRCLMPTRVAITRSRWLYTYHHRQGLKPGDISRKLLQEGIKATRRGIVKFLMKFIESGSVTRKPRSGRPSKRNGLEWTVLRRV